MVLRFFFGAGLWMAALWGGAATAAEPVSPPYFCRASSCVGFTHDGGSEALVLDTVAQAKSDIRIAAYSFSSKAVAKALIDAKKRGVEVRIILDRAHAGDRYSSATFLRNQGFEVRTVSLGKEALMHHKFMVIDDRYVQTGSFNYTRAAAQRNAENVLRIDDRDIAREYSKEWSRLWHLGKSGGKSR